MRDLLKDILSLLQVLLLQVFLYVRSDLRNVDAGVPPLHWLSVGSHQKLLKVPLDVAEFKRLPEQSAIGVIEVFSNWRARALHKPKKKKKTQNRIHE